AVGGDFGPVLLAGRPRLQRHLRDATDRGERFAAEAQRADPEQVVGRAQLAGRVTGKGETEVVGGDAAAVVDHPDQLRAALFDLHVDACAAGVDGVLEQLLHDTGRAFDDFAGGDF